jgi:K+-sensing histidine kinase KdpD
VNSHLPISGRLANEGEAYAGNSFAVASQPDDSPAPLRFLAAFALSLLKALACVAVATVALLLLDRLLPFSLFTIVYLIPVVIAATRWGTWPAIAAAIAGGGAADFLFFTPFYSFSIDDPQEVIDLLLFLFVALVSGHLASRLRSEKETLKQRETELHYLYEFSRRLAACFTIPDLVAAIQDHLARTLGQQALFFVARTDGHLEPLEAGLVPREVEERVGSMIAKIGLPAFTILDAPTQSIWLLRAVHSDATVHGVIAVNVGSGSRAVIAAKTNRVEAVLDEASLTLQRLDIGNAMEEAKLQLQAQLLKDALHGMLSHELRSPLSAIQGSASVLGSAPVIRNDARLYPLTEAIADEVQRLDGFIQNLVNTARVTTNSVQPRLEWADPRDIVNAVVGSRSRRLAQHRVKVEFDDDLPLVNVDSALVQESLGQLLDNAAKYSPSGSPISVAVRAQPGQVGLSVSDQGLGLTPQEKLRLGLRSFRSQRFRESIPGSGLGFWIASVFVRANGGKIEISSRGAGLGTTASIVLPASWIDESDSAALANE